MPGKHYVEKVFEGLQIIGILEGFNCSALLPHFRGTLSDFERNYKGGSGLLSPAFLTDRWIGYYAQVYLLAMERGIDTRKVWPNQESSRTTHRVSREVWNETLSLDYDFAGHGLHREGTTSWIVGPVQLLTDEYRQTGVMRMKDSGMLKIEKSPEERKPESVKRYLSRHPDPFGNEVDALQSITSQRVPGFISTGICANRRYILCTADYGQAVYSHYFCDLEDILAYQSKCAVPPMGVDALTEEHEQQVAKTAKAYLAKWHEARELRFLKGWAERAGIELPPMEPEMVPDSMPAHIVDGLATACPSFLNYGVLAPLFLRQIAECLGDIHAEGFIHRDIKPKNFLVSFLRDACLINISLCDFHAAGRLDASGVHRGPAYGSEVYASPELLQNAIKGDVLLTVASDIFSYGLVMARIIDPCIRRDELPQLESRLEAGTLARAVDALSQRIDGNYRGIFQKCCAYRPQDRYRCIPELLDALSAVEARTR